jgi:hypothetical protein
MRAKTLFLFGLLIAMVGCNNDDEIIQANVNGDYVGIFERNGNTSNVELTFNTGTFNGQSEIQKFPALCSGTYVISENTIVFANDCAWTAEFDWSLILSGEWTFNLNNNVLTMTKSNGDKYTLIHQ